MYYSKPQFDVRPYFSELNDQLIQMLEDLDPEEWQAPTIAGRWRVKDVVAHLLDGDIRTLSIQRDRYFGESPPESNEYNQMVAWLNQLNADWVRASRRISPEVLILLHKTTGPLVSRYYESLDPLTEAIFPVQWAGEEKSLNWMHLAREFSEKWHHQQQIADATGRAGLLRPDYYKPLIMTFMLAIPHVLREEAINPGDTIGIHTNGDVSDSWFISFTGTSWQFITTPESVRAEITLPANIAWKLFSKSLRPEHLGGNIRIAGDINIADKVINMISVMA